MLKVRERIQFKFNYPSTITYILSSSKQSIGSCTITDDDSPAQLSIADTICAENSGTCSIVVSVTPISEYAISVTVNTAAGTATTTNDFTQISALTLNIAALQPTASITLTIAEDTLDEDNEVLLVQLSNPTFSTISDSQATVTITDNDPLPFVSIADLTITEDNSNTPVNFQLTLNVASGRSLTVDYSTTAGTASHGSDLIAATGTVTFAAGSTSQTIAINIVGDNVHENSETFNVNLLNPTNVVVSDSLAVGTVTDDDPYPDFSVSDPTLAENGGPASFVVTLTRPSQPVVTVSWDTVSGTAVSGSDFVAVVAGSITFSSLDTSETITVTLVDDGIHEPVETFTVVLSGQSGGNILDVGVATIQNDDPPPNMSIDSPTVLETSGIGTTPLTFTVSLNIASSFAITVDWIATDGTAIHPGDYTRGAGYTGSLSFAAGETTKTITFDVVADDNDEPNQAFTVTLANPVNAVIIVGSGNYIV